MLVVQILFFFFFFEGSSSFVISILYIYIKKKILSTLLSYIFSFKNATNFKHK